LLQNIATAVPVGLAFGAAVTLSGVSSPEIIRGQFIFDKYIMFKMFLGALGTSALSFVILSLLNPKEFEKARESRGFGDKGAGSAILGGGIQGAGMALAGSCPGMAFAQLGAGIASAPATYLGGVFGASLYSYMHPWLKGHHVFDFTRTLEGKVDSMHLERVFFGGRFIPTALSFAAIAYFAALALEVTYPWRIDANGLQTVPEGKAINPILAGVIVGGLQIPTFLSLSSFLGASSGYSVVASQVLRWIPEEFLKEHAYARAFMNSKASWQIGLGLGISVGAALATGLSYSDVTSLLAVDFSQRFSNVPSIPTLQSFIGGALIVFGARFTGGCASGHGLSGMPALHIISWITVPSMFAGAILVGNFLSRVVMSRSEYLLAM